LSVDLKIYGRISGSITILFSWSLLESIGLKNKCLYYLHISKNLL
jgi:hypothetical protein